MIYPNFSNGFAKSPFESSHPDLWQGLIGIWSPEMGNQSGFLYDFSNHGYKATLNSFALSGATSNYVAGKFGLALNFDGTNDNITTANIPQINSVAQTITVMMWVRTTATGNKCLCSYDQDNSLSPGSDLYIYGPAGLNYGGFSQGHEISSGIAINDGKWHHIAIVGRQTSVELWIDGILRLNTTGETKKATDYTTSHTFRLGDDSNITFYQGDIGEVRLYNYDISPDQVRRSYLGASPLTLSPFITTYYDGSITVTPTLQSIATSVLAPTIISSPIVTPTILTVQTDVIPPTSASVTVSITVAIQSVTTSVLAPTISGDANVTAALQTVTTSILSPLVPQSITVTPTVLIVATSQVTPNFVGESTTFSAFATKIVSINPLIFVTDTNPARIAKVDTTIPTALTWQVTDLIGATNALSVAINKNTEFLYVACANGIIVKVELADITNQEIIDLGDTDDLITIDVLSNYSTVYTGTDNPIGELYLIDEREEVIGDLRLDVLAQITEYADLQFNIIEAQTMDSNCQFIGQVTAIMNCDFKCLTHELDNIVPLKRPDVHIFLDGVELGDTDLDLSSIQISHTIGNDSTATFNLTRKHDKLNTDLAGNVRTITNQNTVDIYLGTYLEFTGKISDIDCQYSENSDSISLTVIGDEKENLYNSVLLSLPGLQERLSLYHVMINNPKISNPFIDPTKVNPKKYKGILIDLGNKTVQSVGQYLVFDNTGSIANKIQAGTFNPQQNWTYFWSPTLTRFGNFNSLTQNQKNDAKIQPGPSDIPFSTYTQPDYGLPAVRVNSTNSPFFNLGSTDSIFYSYIGTSLSPVSEDLWIINNAQHRLQRIRTDIVTRLGEGIIYAGYFDNITGYDSTAIYTAVQSAGYVDGSGNITLKFKLVTNGNDLDLNYPSSIRNDIFTIINENLGYTYGEAPFKKVSVKSGIFIPKMRWEDREDGLYAVTDAGFDLTSYVQQVAALEYQKLLNINGQILPDTSCQLSLTFDGYLYHGLSLCSRINIDNTTQLDIFNGNNGFPVSIKGINIDTGTMKVSISADNSKSTKELEALDGLYPHDDDPVFNTDATAHFLAQKSDLRTGLPVQ